MPRWKPIVYTFGFLLLIYVLLLNQNGDTVIPRFNRINAFDAAQEGEQVSGENDTGNVEVLLLDHPPEVLDKLIANARAECHDNLVQEKTDIHIKGQNVVYDPGFTTPNLTNDIINVHVIFHSHIDPGWLRTFDEYYNEKVKYIFENAINFLLNHNDARFIWSEMSYLNEFYRLSKQETKDKIKSLISSGQLELCGGAWVMTDEATPYFWATIDNIIEGQRFIFDEFNATARSSWSVDPFGHGAATPYLLSLTDIQNLVVGRLDRHVKENMAEHRALLYNWAQPFNTGLESNLPLISSLPRTYYTTTDACGPDSNVCCQFDFGNARSSCSGRAKISQTSVAKYAKMLTDQYKQLHPFYRSKQLLIAIGDDFFFSEPKDFTENYNSYRQLIDHINTNPSYGMNIKFSTVNEYFEAIRAEQQAYPILRGDFFPYTENKDGSHPYWSGYFVHRPYFKRLERIVQGQLRRLDILRSLSNQITRFDILQEHRRNLALVQHHDAITGTSKPHVMKDYTDRLLNAESKFRQLEADVLGGLDYVTFIDSSHPLEFTEKTQIHRLVIYNQHTSTSPQRISILTNMPNVAVSSADGTLIEAQVFPYMELSQWAQSSKIFELIFYIRVPALGTRRITVSVTNQMSTATTLLLEKHSNSTVVSNESSAENLNGNPEETEKQGLLVDCGSFTLRFDDNGLLQSFKRDDTNDEEVKLRMNYGFYEDRGGAYVFVPQGHQKTATLKNSGQEPVILMGPQTVRVMSKLQFTEPTKYELYQFIEIPRNQSSKSIEIRIELLSSPTHLDGLTFVMNFETDIDNSDSLFTDVNGLYLTRREMNDGVAHAANFYPAASSTLIEDHNERLTVLFGQPTGATTSRRGHLEFFVDRNVKGSDGKGLDYGDSSTTETTRLKYRLLIEKRDSAHAHKTIYLSKHAHDALELLLHPSSVYQTRDAKNFPGVLWPCNVQLINIRHLRQPEGTVLLILRRLDFDCTVMDEPCVNGGDALLFNTLKQLFPGKRMRFTSLTGSHDGAEIQDESALNERLKAFHIVSLKYE